MQLLIEVRFGEAPDQTRAHFAVALNPALMPGEDGADNGLDVMLTLASGVLRAYIDDDGPTAIRRGDADHACSLLCDGFDRLKGGAISCRSALMPGAISTLKLEPATAASLLRAGVPLLVYAPGEYVMLPDQRRVDIASFVLPAPDRTFRPPDNRESFANPGETTTALITGMFAAALPATLTRRRFIDATMAAAAIGLMLRQPLEPSLSYARNARYLWTNTGSAMTALEYRFILASERGWLPERWSAGPGLADALAEARVHAPAATAAGERIGAVLKRRLARLVAQGGVEDRLDDVLKGTSALAIGAFEHGSEPDLVAKGFSYHQLLEARAWLDDLRAAALADDERTSS